MELKTTTVIWYTLLAAFTLVSFYQVAELVNDWTKRPMDILEVVRTKQDIPFPSITICPEGNTVNSALEMYLNKLQLNYKDFPKTVESYLSLQLENIRFYMTLKKIYLLEYFCQHIWLKDIDKNTPFCQFSLIFNALVHQAVVDNKHFDVAKDLWDSLKEVINIDMIQNQQLKWDLTRLKWGSKRIKGFASLYAYLALKKVAELKMRQNKVNTMKLFFDHLNYKKVNMGKFNAVSSFPTVPLSDPLVDDEKIFPKPPVLYSYQVHHAEQFWSLSTANLTASKNDSLADFQNKSSLTKKELLTLYNQLIYLQTKDLTKNLGNMMIQLLSHNNNEQLLPAPLVCEYWSEITSLLTNLLRSKKQLANTKLNLKDAVSLLTIQGHNAMNEFLDIMSNPQCSLTSALSKSEALSWYKTIYLKKYENFYKTWASKNGSNLLKDISSVVQQKEFIELLYNTAHSSMYWQNGFSPSQPISTVPFCFVGQEIAETIIKFKYIFPFTITNNSFCVHTQQVYTDIGICTAINFQSQANILQDSFMAAKFDGKKNWLPFHPQSTTDHGTRVKSFKQSEDGMLMILDSSSFGNEVSKNRPKNFFSGQIELAESLQKNNFKVILHNNNEIPTFLQPQSTRFVMDRTSLNLLLPFHKTKIKVDIQDADDNIRGLDIAIRECRFEDETKGLKMFKVYSEVNCMYECKMELSKKKCGCVPWNFPHSSGDRLCDPIGNLCFNHHMLWLFDNMYSLKHIGSPPCGCYPSCRSHLYSLEQQEVEQAPFYWIDPEGEVLKLYNFKQEYGVFIHETAFLHRFLSRYIYHSISPNRISSISHSETVERFKYLVPNEIAKKHGPENTELESRMNNLAMLHVNFDSNNYQARIKTKRTSFSMMLSSFGGILSLFTGFSFMTLFDLCRWLKKSVHNIEWRKNMFEMCQ